MGSSKPRGEPARLDQYPDPAGTAPLGGTFEIPTTPWDIYQAIETSDVKRFAPAYPRVALSTTFGTLTLIGLAAIGGVLRESLDGIAETISVALQILVSAAALLRIARVRVTLVDNANLVVVNPIRTRTVAVTDVADIEEAGFIYKWLTLTTLGGKRIPVAASLYVLTPSGRASKELYAKA